MNEHEQFEKRLRRQPLRTAPPAWREEILSAVREVETSRRPLPTTRHSYFLNLNQKISALLRPDRRAWAGLAAVWVVICAMNFMSRNDTASTAARHVAPPTPQLREMLRAQELLLAELVGETPFANRRKSVPPQPHSYYRNEFLNA